MTKIKRIKLNNDNMTKEVIGDIMFISIAEPGAMGSASEIIIYNNNAQRFSFNYVHDDIDVEKIHDAIPLIKECYFSSKTKEYPDGWEFMYLGFGNNLLIKEELYEIYSDMMGKVSPAVAYGQWQELAEDLLITIYDSEHNEM